LLALLLLPIDCTPPDVAGRVAVQEAPAEAQAVALAAVRVETTSASGTISEAARMPGPATTARADAPARNAACEGCHRDIAAEWRGSLHHRAYTEATFARALAREPTGFCRGCHAPEADPSRPAPKALAALGVGCISCHAPAHAGLADGAVWAGPAATGAAPHPVVPSAAFAGVPGCANCHEFGFDHEPAMLMQATVREHAASRFAGSSCADCHMPRVGEGSRRHRSHGFAASRDPALLRTALQVEARRSRGSITLRLVPAAVGHAVPTGDLFRRLWIEAETRDSGGEVVAHAARAPGRRFGHHHDGVLRRKLELADDRPGGPQAAADGGITVVLELGAEVDASTVRWRVLHQRVELPLQDDEAIIAGTIELAAGTLPPLENGQP